MTPTTALGFHKITRHTCLQKWEIPRRTVDGDPDEANWDQDEPEISNRVARGNMGAAKVVDLGQFDRVLSAIRDHKNRWMLPARKLRHRHTTLERHLEADVNVLTQASPAKSSQRRHGGHLRHQTCRETKTMTEGRTLFRSVLTVAGQPSSAC